MPGGSKVAARVILVEDSTIQIAFFQPGIVSELMDTMTHLNAPIQIRISHTPITEE